MTNKGKYLLEANFRADASSRFAKGYRWDTSRLSLPDGVFRKKILWKIREAGCSL